MRPGELLPGAWAGDLGMLSLTCWWPGRNGIRIDRIMFSAVRDEGQIFDLQYLATGIGTSLTQVRLVRQIPFFSGIRCQGKKAICGTSA